MIGFYRARSRDFGAAFLSMDTGNIASFTANATTRYGIGMLSDKDDTGSKGHTGYVDEMFVAQYTVCIDTDGTTLLHIKKYDASAGAAVTLASSFNLEGQTDGKADRVPFDSGVTDAQRILDFGDYLFCEVVNNSAAFDTNTAAASVRVMVKLLT